MNKLLKMCWLLLINLLEIRVNLFYEIDSELNHIFLWSVVSECCWYYGMCDWLLVVEWAAGGCQLVSVSQALAVQECTETADVCWRRTSRDQATRSECTRLYCSNVQIVCMWSSWCHTHTHTRLTAFFLGLPRWAGTRKVKPIWILLKQETVSGSGISWATCKSAPCSRQIATPAPHHSLFYRPDALPAAQPTASKHWRQYDLICWRIFSRKPVQSYSDNNIIIIITKAFT